MKNKEGGKLLWLEIPLNNHPSRNAGIVTRKQYLVSGKFNMAQSGAKKHLPGCFLIDEFDQKSIIGLLGEEKAISVIELIKFLDFAVHLLVNIENVMYSAL